MRRLERFFLLIGLLFLCGLASATARAFTCDILFHSTETSAGTKAVLQASVDRLQLEQKNVRDRVWMPRQLTEIAKKGRLEFEDMDRATKYYRGLITWKLRVLQEEIGKISEAQLLADFKAKWPTTIKVRETDVALFSSPRDFFNTLEISESVLKVAAPTAEQVASLMAVTSRIRSLSRTSWANREAADAAMFELLKAVYPQVEAKQISEIAEALNKPKAEKIICCGRGNCAECTHPNVVFRDKEKPPGPTHEGPAPRSTLPLYEVMDLLKTMFPHRDWGTGFWDSAVPDHS